MTMQGGFWERLDSLIENRKAITRELNLAPNAVSLWIKRKTYPACDTACALAKRLDVTVEELVEGDEGRSYVLEWAAQNGGRWKPPPRIARLVDCATILNDEELKNLEEMADFLRAKHEREGLLATEKNVKSS